MKIPANAIVISPHLDDGVFSCGEAIAAADRAVVITVFAGIPQQQGDVTSWDAACGFRLGDDAVSIRRKEDKKALGTLGALPLWLDFLDAQYGGGAAPEKISPYLFAAVSALQKKGEINRVCFPLGLFHSDHVLVRSATLGIVNEFPDLEWIAYEDAAYRCIDGVCEEALAQMHSDGIYTLPYRFRCNDETHRLKRQAVMCYRSQLAGLTTRNKSGFEDLLNAERYFLLVPQSQPSNAGVRAPSVRA
jgi:LmbE family N-acetylglucosaminyl deacetylase